MTRIGAPTISIIVAIANNNVIGNNNKLPWHLPDDLKNFKEVTMGHPILMGYETLVSMGRGLPGRLNLVLTSDPSKLQRFSGNIQALGSISSAIEFSRNEDLFLIGGQFVFEQFINCPEVGKMYITRVHANVVGDRHFPLHDYSGWKKISSKRHAKDNRNEYDFSFEVWERVGNFNSR